MIKLSTLVKDSGIAVGVTGLVTASIIVLSSYDYQEKNSPILAYALAGLIATAGIGIGAGTIKLGNYLQIQENESLTREKNYVNQQPKNQPIKPSKNNQCGIATPYTRSELGIKYLEE